MAALIRSGLLTKFSQLQISANTLKLTSAISNSSQLQVLPSFDKCLTRTLRSCTNGFEGTRLNAAQEATKRPRQEVVNDPDDTDLAITNDVITKVNNQIQSNSHGRLFAIIQIAGKQWRVTDGDLLMVEGVYPTDVGDVIRLEKILLLGSKDFTLMGRPILRPDLVRVEATIVEKSLTHIKTHFKKKRRKNYKRINFMRNHFTILRINCVRLDGLVDKRPEIEGVDGRVF